MNISVFERKCIAWLVDNVVSKAFGSSLERYAVTFMLPLKAREMHEFVFGHIDEIKSWGFVVNDEVCLDRLFEHAIQTLELSGGTIDFSVGSRHVTFDKNDFTSLWDYLKNS